LRTAEFPCTPAGLVKVRVSSTPFQVEGRLRDLKISITANKVIRPSEIIFSDGLSNGITSPLSPS
jgi:hypothetical protein